MTNKTWKKTVAKYRKPEAMRSWWQVANSLIPYFLLWFLMLKSLEISYWLTLLLAVPTAGFMLRIFIIFHDCGHGSFFESRRLNDILGFITGVITFTPYYQWRHSHAIHHATVCNLDRRGSVDVFTLTVDEYLAMPTWKRLAYRAYRHPLVMFTVFSFGLFAFGQRFPIRAYGKRERYSVHWTNLGLLVIFLLLSYAIGLKAYLMVQLPVLFISASAGVWLFYVQHQFEGVRWERRERWDFVAAAIKSSSYYKLPKVLQWFTGNIGFHHVHHISPRIPNYFLEKCHNDDPLFTSVEPVTLLSSTKSLFLRLWDEERRVLIGFGELKKIQQSLSP